jgi:hypothetical protein
MFMRPLAQIDQTTKEREDNAKTQNQPNWSHLSGFVLATVDGMSCHARGRGAACVNWYAMVGARKRIDALWRRCAIISSVHDNKAVVRATLHRKTW